MKISNTPCSFPPFTKLKMLITFRSTCNQRAVNTINEYYTSLANIYFQQYDIAPYAAGFPEFMLGVATPFMI